VLIVVALQGQPSLTATGEGPPGAFDAARSLLESVRSALKQVRLVSRGQAVGRYRTPWGGGSEILAAADLDSVVWPGRPVVLRLFARTVRPPLAGGSAVGRLDVSANGGLLVVPVVVADGLGGPTTRWRLSPHPVPAPISRAGPKL